jgi:hypothetical protein
MPALSLLPLVAVTLLAPLMLVQLRLPVRQTVLMVLKLVLLTLFLGAGVVALHGAAPAVERQAPQPLAAQSALPQAVAAALPAAQASLHVPERRLPGWLPAAWWM